MEAPTPEIGELKKQTDPPVFFNMRGRPKQTGPPVCFNTRGRPNSNKNPQQKDQKDGPHGPTPHTCSARRTRTPARRQNTIERIRTNEDKSWVPSKGGSRVQPMEFPLHRLWHELLMAAHASPPRNATSTSGADLRDDGPRCRSRLRVTSSVTHDCFTLLLIGENRFESTEFEIFEYPISEP